MFKDIIVLLIYFYLATRDYVYILKGYVWVLKGYVWVSAVLNISFNVEIDRITK